MWAMCFVGIWLEPFIFHGKSQHFLTCWAIFLGGLPDPKPANLVENIGLYNWLVTSTRLRHIPEIWFSFICSYQGSYSTTHLADKNAGATSDFLNRKENVDTWNQLVVSTRKSLVKWDHLPRQKNKYLKPLPRPPRFGFSHGSHPNLRFSGPSVPSLGMATGASTLCSSKGRVPRANAKATWQHQQRSLDIMDFPSLLPSAVVVLEWVSRVPKHLLAGYLEHRRCNRCLQFGKQFDCKWAPHCNNWI